SGLFLVVSISFVSAVASVGLNSPVWIVSATVVSVTGWSIFCVSVELLSVFSRTISET
ncbi:14373_t:CDS:1, partial [Racocetra persica]